MKNLVVLIVALLVSQANLAQNVGINSTGANPDNSAMLDVSSTTSGILVPRMTSIQRVAIPTPAKGLLVFDNTTSTFWFFNGIIWIELVPGGGNPLIDADGDTKVDVEETPDEDLIRFDLQGTEKWLMTGSRLQPQNTGNSLFLGTNAGLNDNLTNNENVFLGPYSGTANTNGAWNVGVGTYTLNANTTGSSSIGIGEWALASNTTGSYNISLGSFANYSNTTGASNIGIGASALQNNTTGRSNLAIGDVSMDRLTDGTQNIGIGFGSLGGVGNTSHNNATFIGYQSGEISPDPTNSVGLGYQAGRYAGSNGVYLGYQSGGTDNTANKLYIENSNSLNPLIWGDFANDSLTVHGTLTVSNPATGANHYSFPNADGTINQVLQTDGAGNVTWGAISSNPLVDTDGDTKVDVEETADEDIIRFDLAGVEKWVMIDSRLQYNSTQGELFIGDAAGISSGSGSDNSFVGAQAGMSLAAGNGNTALGRSALRQNTAGSFNTSIGSYAGMVSQGSHNVSLGFRAGFSSNGQGNVYIGNFAGQSNTTGDGNIFIGTTAGSTSTVSRQLMIDNSNTVNPLIWGDFTANILRTNGIFQINDPAINGFAFPAVDGTANQVLQTDGTGQLSWVNGGINTDNQDLALVGNTLSVTNDASTVDLSGYLDNTDSQTLSITGSTLSIGGGNSVVLPSGGNPLSDADGDTKMDVETTADEDIIRFSLGDATNTSTERWVMTSRRLEPANSANNMFIGLSTGVNTSGDHNTFLGSFTGANTLGGAQNTAVGSQAFANNTTGSFNSSYGVAALASNVDGNDNTAIGTVALQFNTDGNNNTAVGSSALNANTTGLDNTAVGRAALSSNIGGGSNTAVGFIALSSNTSGDNNTAVGREALRLNTTGENNLAVGTAALQSNNNVDNTALGAFSLSNATGFRNTAVGRGSMNGATTGNVNTALGFNSLRAVSTGSFNVAIGNSALENVGVGGSNVAVGTGAGANLIGGSGNVLLGANAGASFSGSNQLFIANTNLTTLIHGDFSTDQVSINNQLGIGGAPVTTYDLTLRGTAGGHAIAMENAKIIDAKNSAGVYENFLFPRWSDDITYLNYGSAGFNIRNNSNVSTMFMTNGGNVGIGTATPVNGKLEISGGATRTVPALDYFAQGSAGVQAYAGGGNGDYSIWASDRIAGLQFEAVSDERIKDIKGLSDNAEDLETLMDIEITNYQYKDKLANGNEVQKKVIAQQVKSVYPVAVNDNATRVVPDIYQVAEINNGWISLATDLEIGDKVKIITESEEKLYDVLATNETGFKIERATNQKVFVYGKEVHDFHTVDYDALSTLNISATQELVRKTLQLEKKVAELEITNETRLQQLEAMVKSLLDVKEMNNRSTTNSVSANK